MIKLKNKIFNYINPVEIIFTKENEKILSFVNKDIVDGDTFESNAIKNFYLFCKYSLKREIVIERQSTKNSKILNNFCKNFNFLNLINNFQIDAYIEYLYGSEINELYKNFSKNFFLFENCNVIEDSKYEIIGEVAKDIVKQSQQKLSQIINYINLIQNFNKLRNYEKNEQKEKQYSNICKEYGFTKENEKILVLLTDGSFFSIKYILQFIQNNKNYFDNFSNPDLHKKEIIDFIKNKIEIDGLFKMLNIRPEYIYHFHNLYFKLKNSHIKFFICFISETLEDKFENKILDNIKYYLYDDKNVSDPFIIKLLNDYKENEKLKLKFSKICNIMKIEIKNFILKKETKFIEDFKKYILDYFVSKKSDLKYLNNSIIKKIDVIKFNPESICNIKIFFY